LNYKCTKCNYRPPRWSFYLVLSYFLSQRKDLFIKKFGQTERAAYICIHCVYIRTNQSLFKTGSWFIKKWRETGSMTRWQPSTSGGKGANSCLNRYGLGAYK